MYILYIRIHSEYKTCLRLIQEVVLKEGAHDGSCPARSSDWGSGWLQHYVTILIEYWNVLLNIKLE